MIIVEIKVVDDDGYLNTHLVETEQSDYNRDIERFFGLLSVKVQRIVDGKACNDD